MTVSWLSFLIRKHLKSRKEFGIRLEVIGRGLNSIKLIETEYVLMWGGCLDSPLNQDRWDNHEDYDFNIPTKWEKIC